MARKDYWEQRMIQLFNAQDKRDAVFQKKLAKEYNRTAAAIEKDIASYYASYGEDDVIEYRKLVKRLGKTERDLLYKNYEAFALKYPQYQNLMPVRESIYKLNRLEGLQLSVRQNMLELGAIEQEVFAAHLREAYEKGYLSTMQGLQNSTAFFAANGQVLEQTLNARWVNGENFSSRIWGNKDALTAALNNEVRDAFIRGEGYRQMTKLIQHRTGVGKFRAKRLVATESAFMMGQANGQAFRNEGVKRYEISAVMDSRTSNVCRTLDGDIFNFDEAVVGSNYPPFHSFCRSTVLPVENS